MYPDDQYENIKFETGETAWIKWEDDIYLGLIFQDLTAGYRRKSKLPKYEVLTTPENSEKFNFKKG